MARIVMQGLAHSYRAAPSAPQDFALQPLDIDWRDGGAYALLGPSGCGKTTLLNIVSGLVRASHGRVQFDGRDVTGLSPAQRNIAQVFQFPVVYDSMSVAQNLAFPLRNRGVPADRIRDRVGRIAEMLDLSSMLDRRASGLSADARQKISLGRGLVREDVAAVLFDEPLTVIDPHLKWQLRRKLKQIHHELKLTLVYVTHDQVEALTFADEVVVMSAGRVVQTGTADALFEDPAHAFVGHFIGSPGMNFLPATRADGRLRLAGLEPAGPLTGDLVQRLGALVDAAAADVAATAGTAADDAALNEAIADPNRVAGVPERGVLLGIRPEYVTLHAEALPGCVRARVVRVQDLGTSTLVTAVLDDAAAQPQDQPMQQTQPDQPMQQRQHGQHGQQGPHGQQTPHPAHAPQPPHAPQGPQMLLRARLAAGQPVPAVGDHAAFGVLNGHARLYRDLALVP